MNSLKFDITVESNFLWKNGKQVQSTTPEGNQRLSRGKPVRSGNSTGQLGESLLGSEPFYCSFERNQPAKGLIERCQA